MSLIIKPTLTLALLWVGVGIMHGHAQLIGTEQSVSKTVFRGDFTVAGDKDTYYPVVFKQGQQNIINHLKIYRAHHEAGPNELSLTHKGALLLEIDVNYGGWGGITYGWKIAALQEAYHSTFANAHHAMHNIGFVVYLRGGGFLYHYESEKPANLQVAYSTDEIIYNNSNPAWVVRANPPLTAVNSTNINNRRMAIKADNPWQLNGSTVSYLNGSVAIGTTNPKSYRLAVGGPAVAEKVKVSKQTNWADHVFAPAYELPTLEQVSEYIQQNGHLPEVPTASQVAADGYDLGDMDATLLKKIEELTLYVIAQNKKIESLEARQSEAQKSENLSKNSIFHKTRWRMFEAKKRDR